MLWGYLALPRFAPETRRRIHAPHSNPSSSHHSHAPGQTKLGQQQNSLESYRIDCLDVSKATGLTVAIFASSVARFASVFIVDYYLNDAPLSFFYYAAGCAALRTRVPGLASPNGFRSLPCNPFFRAGSSVLQARQGDPPVQGGLGRPFPRRLVFCGSRPGRDKS